METEIADLTAKIDKMTAEAKKLKESKIEEVRVKQAESHRSHPRVDLDVRRCGCAVCTATHPCALAARG